ncbi:hypothetical protein [Sporichthya polymorpha]|uniref:hypothetical protein n=1 Tax=Sporichthya polymorpha TaxID=35751 RepID=UPI00037EFC6A|nr:hypothetical protein [Sporichthya polymorpha]
MTTPQNDPSLQELLTQVREAVSEASAEMRQFQVEFVQEQEAARRERDEAEQERAEKARSGELGPEQQRLQERIDAGQTSWEAVVSGADTSPEAAETRTQIDQGAEAFTNALAESLDNDQLAGRPDPRAEILETFAQLRAAVAQIAAEDQEMRRGQ